MITLCRCWLIALLCTVVTTVQAAALYHIGVVVDSGSQNHGAWAMIRTFGEIKNGGMIDLRTYPRDFIARQKNAVAQIISLAEDPLMKAIIVNQAIPGTLEAFRAVRNKRPEMLLIAIKPHEEQLALSQYASLVLNDDFIASGYRTLWTAKALGARNFVHLSFPRHLRIEAVLRHRKIMDEASKELGLRFIDETVLDPQDRCGISCAQQYVHDKLPLWLEKYGPETTFFVTNNELVEPLIRQIIKFGGYFIGSSPLQGYPAALGIKLRKGYQDFDLVMRDVEEAIIARGAAGRLGSKPYSFPYASLAGSVQHAINCIEGRSHITDLHDLFRAFGKFAAGAKWVASYYVDASQNQKIGNVILMQQDAYVFGKSYMHATEVDVPQKYFTIPFTP